MTDKKAPEGRFGRCLNEGRCNLADTNAQIPLVDDAPMTCPSCHLQIVLRPPPGKPLIAIEKERKPPPRWLLVFGSVVAVAIAAGFAFNLFDPPDDPPEAATEIEIVPPAEEIAEPILPAGRRTNVMLFTLGATPETLDRAAPALASAFMDSKGCAGVSEKRISGGKLRLGCDKDEIRFYIDIAPVDAQSAFDKRFGRQIDLLLTTDQTMGKQLRDQKIVGFGAAAIIVNAANPLRRLTVSELASVFSGDTSRFNAVGGPATDIRRIAGRDTDVEVQAFEATVPGGRLSTATRRLADSPAVALAVTGDPDAIGIINPADIGSTHLLAIKGTANEAVLPSPAAIADGSYPLAQRLHVDIPRGSKVRFARPFADFATSVDGQAVIKGAGYLPLPAGVPARKQAPTP